MTPLPEAHRTSSPPHAVRRRLFQSGLTVLLLLTGCRDRVVFPLAEASCFADDDGDGFGAAAQSCAAPGAVSTGGDCDDTDNTIHPDADEICDERDNNCDGSIDPSGDAQTLDATLWYGDADGDGFGGDSFSLTACTAPSSYVDNNDDCDDLDFWTNPGAGEVCGDGADNDCDGEAEKGCLLYLSALGQPFYGERDNEGGLNVDSADFNGDGIDDVLLGAKASSNGNGTENDGAAYLFLSPHAPPSALSTADTIILGQTNEVDAMGTAISAPGDIDGDGIPDVLITASQLDHPDGEHLAGALHLFSGATLLAGGDLLGEDADITWNGEGKQTYLGADVFGADLDSDDLVEILVSATWAEEKRGRVYLLDADAPAGDAVDGARGAVTGEVEGDQLGQAGTLGAADLDGDGYAEIVIGSYRHNKDSGVVYVFSGPLTGEHDAIDASARIDPEDTEDQLGRAVCPAGDTDGDGYDDLLIAAPDADSSTIDSGAVYLVLGGKSPDALGNQSIEALADASIEGVDSGDRIGTSMDGGVDVSGDGVPDLLFGGDENGGTDSQTTFLVYGPLEGSLIAGTSAMIITGGGGESGASSAAVLLASIDTEGTGGMLIDSDEDDYGAENGGAAWLIPVP